MTNWSCSACAATLDHQPASKGHDFDTPRGHVMMRPIIALSSNLQLSRHNLLGEDLIWAMNS